LNEEHPQFFPSGYVSNLLVNERVSLLLEWVALKTKEVRDNAIHVSQNLELVVNEVCDTLSLGDTCLIVS
jgi:hypothetical protein